VETNLSRGRVRIGEGLDEKTQTKKNEFFLGVSKSGYIPLKFI
jgi:hypothetical protein